MKLMVTSRVGNLDNMVRRKAFENATPIKKSCVVGQPTQWTPKPYPTITVTITSVIDTTQIRDRIGSNHSYRGINMGKEAGHLIRKPL